jgi:hypothetical protein
VSYEGCAFTVTIARMPATAMHIRIGFIFS